MNPFNAEAGSVPAPSDPLEILVARRSAAVVWRAVPYFELRYGERGQRFGLSDGAWLVTLAHMLPEIRDAQVEWLARVLAARGMPSWLVELQLAVSARVGRKLGWARASAMHDAAQALAARRRTRLSDAAFDEAERRFRAAVGPERLGRGTGRLVASAHVDVALGLCASTAACLDWLRDPARFSAPFRSAVEHTGAYVSGELARA